MAQISLEIISLDRHVFNGKVVSLTVPGISGELTILPHHIPLVAPLKAGEITIRETDGQAKYLAIGSGFLVVANDKVSILADSADLLEELSEAKIMEAKEKAEKAIREKQFADDRSFADATAVLEQSLAQLKVLRKRKKPHR
ncbi:ATP synthase F1 subunit epsilon [Candidatus Peregrinibacteria bacterium]|nr:ATP synthase F1 subunit epsilon [Candidatus Peregrinibacteria bacterium]